MQVVARTLSRASRKRDYSPSVDFLTFGGVIRGQVSVQRLKAVGMAYNDALPYPPFLPAKETVPEAVAYTGAASPTAMSIPEWKLRLPVMG